MLLERSRVVAVSDVMIDVVASMIAVVITVTMALWLVIVMFKWIVIIVIDIYSRIVDARLGGVQRNRKEKNERPK